MANEVQAGMDGAAPRQPSVAQADALAAALTLLIRRIPHAGVTGLSREEAVNHLLVRRPSGPDPSFRLALITVATQALSTLKAGNLGAAAAIIERLRLGLDGGWGETASAALVGKVRRALARFDAAERIVDGQLGRLRAILRRSDDPEPRGIGEFGVDGLTGEAGAKLRTAISQLRACLPVADARLAAMTCRLAEEVAAHLSNSEKVRECDDNPFGVRVSIARTLGGAARQLHEVLREVERP
jgi:hypothetical protein